MTDTKDPGWVVGPEFSYPECPVSARREGAGGYGIDVRVDDGHLYTETRIGYRGHYGCEHEVLVRIPLDVLADLLRASGVSLDQGGAL